MLANNTQIYQQKTATQTYIQKEKTKASSKMPTIAEHRKKKIGMFIVLFLLYLAGFKPSNIK